MHDMYDNEAQYCGNGSGSGIQHVHCGNEISYAGWQMHMHIAGNRDIHCIQYNSNPCIYTTNTNTNTNTNGHGHGCLRGVLYMYDM